MQVLRLKNLFPQRYGLGLVWMHLGMGMMGCVSGRIRPVESLDFQKLGGLGQSPPEIQSPLTVEKKTHSWVASPFNQNARSKKGLNRSVQKKHAIRLASRVRRGSQNSIGLNEKFSYQINYLGLQAGEATLEVLPLTTVHDRKVYHIQATLFSSPMLSLLYRFRDRAETFIDYQGLFSHGFHVVLDESKQSRDTLELYDSEKLQAFYWSRWNHQVKGYTETQEFLSIPALSQDSLSSLYYLRMLPLTVGEVIRFPLISEGKAKGAVCTVIRQERWNQESTLVLRLELYDEKGMKTPGEGFLWLTDDAHRVPLKLEVKLRVGKMVARLKHRTLGNSPEPLQLQPSIEALVKPSGA